jgi:hypothetical protein
MEVPGIHSQQQVLAMVENCLTFYKGHSTKGQRFSKILTSLDQILS